MTRLSKNHSVVYVLYFYVQKEISDLLGTVFRIPFVSE